MPVWTQGEQQKTELLQGEAGEGEGASPPLKLDLSLFQRECQAKEGEGTRLLLNLHLSLSQREYQVKEGEGTCLLPDLDHPPSCNNSTEIPPAQRECQAKEGEGNRLLLNLHLSLSQREYQVKEGEGTCLLPDLDHPPSYNNSQEIPAHHPGGQLA